MNHANDARRIRRCCLRWQPAVCRVPAPGRERGGHLEQGLDGRPASTDNFPDMDDETAERLLVEIEDLRASRARLVANADADRRAFERSLHDGVQQELVALLVNLQRARGLCETDPAAAGALLEESGRDVRIALEGLRRLGLEIYPPLLDARGLVVALRSAAADAGIVVSVDAELPSTCPPEVAAAAYFCCLEALKSAVRSAGAGAKAVVSIRLEGAALLFEIAIDGSEFAPDDLRRIGDRVDALGGRLEIEAEPGEGPRLRGSLPIGSGLTGR
jgi:signal transduction histidine kinase